MAFTRVLWERQSYFWIRPTIVHTDRSGTFKTAVVKERKQMQ